MRKPLSRAAMREFRITGSWSDPVVQSIPHQNKESAHATPGSPPAPENAASEPRAESAGKH